MSSIWWEETIAVPGGRAWEWLRRVDLAHELFAPVLVDGRIEDDVRTVTFADGLVVRERIVDVDETHRRIAYTVLDGLFEHHAASMQIVPVDGQSCRFVWITDFLPADKRAMVKPLVEQGARALATNLEARESQS
jgi:hypothetical protein